jgi:hypothetical protein
VTEETEILGRGTVDRPFYSKVDEDRGTATKLFMIVCDEGWRSSIVCNGLYEWAADWLVEQLQGKLFAPVVD